MTLMLTSSGVGRLVTTENGLRGRELGTGDPVVVLHGFSPGSDSAAEFADQVETLARGFRVVMLDLPGFGLSADLPIVADYLHDAVDRLVASLDELGIEQTAVLASSLGGWVSLQAALSHPDRFGRLALTAPGILSINSAGARPAEGARALSAFLARPSAPGMLAWLETQVADPSTITDHELEVELARAMVPGAIARLKAVARTFDGWEQESALWMQCWRITQPVQLLWGRENRDFLLDGALYGARRMPRADVIALSGCGARPHRERPGDVTRLVTDFLTS
ncbi:alpha/beta fold hydrolase [Nocardioides sp.]|uniref:alpha/beta fold hydrolase n=1 Tax=Nocardioides sp. TaxID=35761 RepID=UPI00263311FD|nr:alpha/beta fold hydrolase [Nocardioides sp.]